MTLSAGAIGYLWAVVCVLYAVPISLLAMIAGRIAGWTIVLASPWPFWRIVLVSPLLSWRDVLLNGLLFVPLLAFGGGLVLGLFVALGLKMLAPDED